MSQNPKAYPKFPEPNPAQNTSCVNEAVPNSDGEALIPVHDVTKTSDGNSSSPAGATPAYQGNGMMQANYSADDSVSEEVASPAANDIGPCQGIQLPPEYNTPEARADMVAIAWVTYGSDPLECPVVVYGERPPVFGQWCPNKSVWVGVTHMQLAAPATITSVVPLEALPLPELPVISYEEYAESLGEESRSAFF